MIITVSKRLTAFSLLVAARSRAFAADESGVLTVWSIMQLIMVLAFAGIALDYANGSRTQSQLQAAVDAAALAGTLDLPNGDTAINSARDFLNRNYPNVVTVAGATIQAGVWNGVTDTFTSPAPLGTDPNAVRVSAGRTGANSVATYLLKFAGITSFNITRQAVAAAQLVAACPGGGFFSRTEAHIQGSNRFTDGVCLHGSTRVGMMNNNSFLNGARVSTTSGSTTSLTAGPSNTFSQRVVPAKVNYDFPLLQIQDTVVNSLQSGSREFYPSYLSTANIVYAASIDQSPNGVRLSNGTRIPLQENTFYIVSGSVTIRSNSLIENIGIYSEGSISIAANVTIRNAMLATRNMTTGSITIGSNASIGNPNVCNNGEYSVYMLGATNIVLNSGNPHVYGLVAGAKQRFEFQSGNLTMQGIYVESGAQTVLQSANRISGCPDPLDSPMGTFDGRLSEIGDEFALVQ